MIGTTTLQVSAGSSVGVSMDEEARRVLTAIRYIVSPDRTPLQGAPLARALRVFYDLPQAEVRTRLEDALRTGRPDVAASDLTGLDTGSVREEVLERLFASETLERAFVGTEEVPARRAV